MKIITCPKCNTDNGRNLYCWNCGNDLRSFSTDQSGIRETSYYPPKSTSTEQSVRRATISQPPKSTFTYQQSFSNTSHDYSALRGIASLCHIIAVGGLILIGSVGVIGGLIAMSESFIGGVGILVSAAISGFLNYIVFKVIAESIFVILDIEANTRRAAASMESVAKRLNSVGS